MSGGLDGELVVRQHDAMGTFRYWTDDAGEDHGLSGHEGYVEAELTIGNPLMGL